MMRFIRYGKTYQLRLRDGKDLAHILKLDESLWMATSAPVAAFRSDSTFIRLLVDSDQSTRITSDEVKAAVGWLLSVLKDRRRIGEEVDTLALAAIQSDSSEGQALIQSAQYVLKVEGKPDSTTISLSQVRRFLADLKAQPLNGDGIIVPAAAGDEALAGFIEDVVTCMGGVVDASGNNGANEEQINAFMHAVRGYLDWRAEGGDGAATTGMMAFGDETAAVYAHVRQHAARVDLYFEQCKALQYDPDTAQRLTKPDAYFKDADVTVWDGLNAFLARAPIAEPTGEVQLPLDPARLNPHYRDWLATLRSTVLNRLISNLGDSLSETQWQAVKAALQPYHDYLGRKAGATVERLPLEKLESYRQGDFQKYAHALLSRDKGVATIRKCVRELERLLLYHRHLLRFANNFVSFSQLYKTDERALFETGSLVIDGRWFNLAVIADDPEAHSAVAKSGSIFTMYLDVQRTTGEPMFRVAVPATSGSKGNLVVGKRGVFFDLDGREYDARITKIISNPISLREALAAPFVNLWNVILGKIEAMSTASEKELEKTADILLPPPAAPAKTPGGPSALFVGLSLSVAAIGSAFAFITKTLAGLTRGQVVLGLVGGIVVIMLPVTLTALIKLQRRDLSSLLEGSGWAINARMRLNRSQRKQFTMSAPYPVDAIGIPRHRRGRLLIAILIVLAVINLVLWSEDHDLGILGTDKLPAKSMSSPQP